MAGLSNDPTAEYNPSGQPRDEHRRRRPPGRACREAGVRRYVFASSCSIYDLGLGDDGKDVVLDETAEVHPRAAYATSKFEAEQQLMAMAGPDFCPVILRKGTVFGFSPRMRYDLVVNTFVKDALSRGTITLFCGGEMWRPLLDVRDAARAYIACLEADEALVRGQVFNVAFHNVRISELALRVRGTVRAMGVGVDIAPGLRLPRRAQLSGVDAQDRAGARLHGHGRRRGGRARNGDRYPTVPLRGLRPPALLQHPLDAVLGRGGTRRCRHRIGVRRAAGVVAATAGAAQQR